LFFIIIWLNWLGVVQKACQFEGGHCNCGVCESHCVREKFGRTHMVMHRLAAPRLPPGDTSN